MLLLVLLLKEAVEDIATWFDRAKFIAYQHSTVLIDLSMGMSPERLGEEVAASRPSVES